MKTTINQNYSIEIPQHVLDELGWCVGDTIEFDIPATGGGIRLTKKSDKLNHYKGVKEVVTPHRVSS